MDKWAAPRRPPARAPRGKRGVTAPGERTSARGSTAAGPRPKTVADLRSKVKVGRSSSGGIIDIPGYEDSPRGDSDNKDGEGRHNDSSHSVGRHGEGRHRDDGHDKDPNTAASRASVKVSDAEEDKQTVVDIVAKQQSASTSQQESANTTSSTSEDNHDVTKSTESPSDPVTSSGFKQDKVPAIKSTLHLKPGKNKARKSIRSAKTLALKALIEKPKEEPKQPEHDSGLDRSVIEDLEREWGKKTYGISKGQLKRTVTLFQEPPPSRPMVACFTFPSSSLTHAHVYKLVLGVVGGFPGAGVTSLQYVDRNVFHGARGMDNRWLVTLSTTEARDHLIGSGLHLFNRVIKVRLYDDVMIEEYDSFLRYQKIQKHMFMRVKSAK